MNKKYFCDTIVDDCLNFDKTVQFGFSKSKNPSI